MKIGILCAGDREAAPFFPMLESGTETQKAMLRFCEGRIENAEVVVLYSGVCKVNATIAAQILIDTFCCDAIINAGTAGAMTENLDILDTVVSTEAAYHDVASGILTEFHPWMDSVWFKADEQLLEIARETARSVGENRKIVFGRMVTGEQFIEDDNRAEINAGFAPLSVDMETAAIAHVCYVNGIPFVAVRTITDTPDHRGAAAFEENCAAASEISAEFVREMLSRMARM